MHFAVTSGSKVRYNLNLAQSEMLCYIFLVGFFEFGR